MFKRFTFNCCIIFTVLVVFSHPSLTQDPKNAITWQDWDFIVEEWVGEGGSETTGSAAGGSSFYFDMDSTLLVRDNFAVYPATDDRPAITHKDKMIIFQQPGSAKVMYKAIYFDNEGHVINYNVSFSDDRNTITFLSEPAPGAQGFRLTYIKGKDNVLTLKFDIAPPGKPDTFSPYITSTLRRK